MDLDAVLARFDSQVRANPEPQPPDGLLERDALTVRTTSPAGERCGVWWSRLSADDADAEIARQIAHFARFSRPWEWKHYSYDTPQDLPRRLIAAGFTPDEQETLLVAEIASLPLDTAPAPGVRLVEVVDEAGVEILAAVQRQVFGADQPGLRATMIDALRDEPPRATPVIAFAGELPIAAGRVEYYDGTGFAGLWGGGTIESWRRRGVFRALVCRRAQLAGARGARYLQVDASSQSRPILERLGFEPLATTTPYMHPGTSA